MAKKAKIYTFSVITSASADFVDKVPYVVAILEDSTGQRFATFVEGYRAGMDVAIGTEVEFSREDSTGKAIYKFQNKDL